jgi:hypothetical protein
LDIGVNRGYGYTDVLVIFLSLPTTSVWQYLSIKDCSFFWDVLMHHPPPISPITKTCLLCFVDVKTPHISVFVPSYHVNGRLHRHKENLTKCLMQHNTSTDSTKEQLCSAVLLLAVLLPQSAQATATSHRTATV